MFSHRYLRRKLLAISLLFLPLLCLSDHLLAEETGGQTEYSLLVLGDSLSAGYGLEQQEGWVSVLQKLWRDEELKIDVVNAAISGETTDGALARLPRLLEQHHPTHLLIELGGNDGLQGHPVNKMKNNLIEMVTLAKQAGAEVFLQDMQIPTNYGKRYTRMFSDSFTQVASSENIALIPFFLQDIALEPGMMQNDGIHPNADAQPIIAEFMRVQLTPLILE